MFQSLPKISKAANSLKTRLKCPNYMSFLGLHGYGAYLMASDKRRDNQQYWEDRLKRMGLDMDRGRPSWLSYGHDVTRLDTDGVSTYRGDRNSEEWEPSSR